MLTESGGTLRAFIALQIPQAARLVLAEAIQSLGDGISTGMRWVDPSGIHLTLKFLGDVEPGQVDHILAAIRTSAGSVTPFCINLTGLGIFPNEKKPRVVWAGIQGDLDSLGELQGRIERASWGLGFAREKWPFSPHLTLGRVKDQISDAERRQVGAVAHSLSLSTDEPWTVDAVHLIRSQLNPSGAIYSTLGSVPLAGLAPPAGSVSSQ